MRSATSLFLAMILLASCRMYKVQQVQPVMEEPVVEKPVPEENLKPRVPQVLVLSVGAADLRGLDEGRSIITHDQLGVDRCHFPSLQIGKDGWLHATTVDGQLTIGGEGRFYGTKVGGEVCVGDDLYACHSQFQGAVDVEGDVIAVDTQFNGPLSATAEIIELTDVQAQSIYVKATGPYYDKQLVYIKGTTCISGDITFESERGRVIFDINTRMEGTIKGGHALPSYECGRIILESNR